MPRRPSVVGQNLLNSTGIAPGGLLRTGLEHAPNGLVILIAGRSGGDWRGFFLALTRSRGGIGYRRTLIAFLCSTLQGGKRRCCPTPARGGIVLRGRIWGRCFACARQGLSSRADGIATAPGLSFPHPAPAPSFQGGERAVTSFACAAEERRLAVDTENSVGLRRRWSIRPPPHPAPPFQGGERAVTSLARTGEVRRFTLCAHGAGFACAVVRRDRIGGAIGVIRSGGVIGCPGEKKSRVREFFCNFVTGLADH